MKKNTVINNLFRNNKDIFVNDNNVLVNNNVINDLPKRRKPFIINFI